MSLRVISITLSLLIGPLAFAETEQAAPVKTPEKPAERPALVMRSQAETAALERQLAANEQQQLKTQANETFLALWRPGNSAPAKGAVILVPGEDQSADWPIGIGPLRRKLPDNGWSTLSLTLPDAEPAPVATRTEAPAPSTATPPTEAAQLEPSEASSGQQKTPAAATADPAEQAQDSPSNPANSDTSNAHQDYATRLLARIAEGISFAQQQGATTIVLAGQGSGAYWAARYLAEQQPPSVNNLLLIAAQAPTDLSPDLDTQLSKLKLATGDFYYKDQPAERDAAKQRLNAAKRQKRTAYIQIAMSSLPGNRDVEQEQLFRRIKGWLNLHLKSTPVTQ